MKSDNVIKYKEKYSRKIGNLDHLNKEYFNYDQDKPLSIRAKLLFYASQGPGFPFLCCVAYSRVTSLWQIIRHLLLISLLLLSCMLLCPLPGILEEDWLIVFKFGGYVCHERVIRVGFRHEQLNRSQHSCNVERWSPGALWWQFENIQTNPPGRINVWMIDGSQKSDLRRFKGVPLGNGNFQLENTFFVRCVSRT